MNKKQLPPEKNKTLNEQGIIDYNKGFVSLPFEDDVFKDFLVKLLGKPQEINKDFAGSYEVNPEMVEGLFLLLDQRITQQNNGNLVNFTASLFFSDSSSIKLSSISELMSYNEIKNVICYGLTLSVSYLIQFPDKKFPEKQEIEINFRAPLNIDLYSNINRREGNSYTMYLLNQLKTGKIDLFIKHTARTWARDIESLLSHRIESLFKQPKPISKFVNNYAEILGTITGVSTLLGLVFGFEINQNNKFYGMKQSELEKYNSFSVSNEKLDYVFNYFLNKDYAINYSETIGLFLFFVAIIISAVIGLLTIQFATIQKPSFILFSAETITYRDKKLKRYNRKWINLFFTILSAIVCGIIANYISKFLF